MDPDWTCISYWNGDIPASCVSFLWCFPCVSNEQPPLPKSEVLSAFSRSLFLPWKKRENQANLGVMYLYRLNPNGATCFEWSLGPVFFFWGGWPSKIEVIGVLGNEYTRWWLNQPLGKICSWNWIISPGIGVNIKKNWNHHLVYVWYLVPGGENVFWWRKSRKKNGFWWKKSGRFRHFTGF